MDMKKSFAILLFTTLVAIGLPAHAKEISLRTDCAKSLQQTAASETDAQVICLHRALVQMHGLQKARSALLRQAQVQAKQAVDGEVLRAFWFKKVAAEMGFDPDAKPDPSVDEYTVPMYLVRVIIMPDQESAQRVTHEALAGAWYGQLARQASQHPISQEEGGLLGWMDKDGLDSFSPEFLPLLQKLKRDEIYTQPLPTVAGWMGAIQWSDIRQNKRSKYMDLQAKVMEETERKLNEEIEHAKRRRGL